MKRRRRVDPSKAREALGFYDRIAITREGWPSCSACGRKTAVVDAQHHECIGCQLERKRQAREASA